MKKLEGKVAIVTGASSGVGRAIAVLSAQEGAKVVCADIRKNPIPGGRDGEIDTDLLIKDNGGEAIYVSCDISKPEQVGQLVKAAVSAFGRLDIIYNNAAVMTGHGTILEKSEEQLSLAIDVNLKGVWYCCREAIRLFKDQGTGGKIINISSIGGTSGIPNIPEYCATKGGVTNLTRQLAVDFGGDGINVNAICPSNIETAMMGVSPEDEMKHLLAATPLHRKGQPADIAGAAVFLASSDADYITGCILPVDGGLSCRH